MTPIALFIAALLIAATPAAAQVGPKPTDPVAAELWERQKQLRRESDRTMDALRRNDLRRQDLSGVAADRGAAGVATEGRARHRALDEAEVERLRAKIRAEAAEKEDRIRRDKD